MCIVVNYLFIIWSSGSLSFEMMVGIYLLMMTIATIWFGQKVRLGFCNMKNPSELFGQLNIYQEFAMCWAQYKDLYLYNFVYLSRKYYSHFTGEEMKA